MYKISKVLLLEGIISALLAALMFFAVHINNGLFLLSTPFELLGNAIRYLSLSSSIGNIIAIIIYLTLSFIPVIYAIIKRKKKVFKPFDVLLPIISIYSLYALYQFINPGYLIDRMPAVLADASAFPYLKLALAIIFYSFSIGYIILCSVGTLSTIKLDDKSSYLYGKLRWILIFISALYTFFLGYFYTFQMFNEIQQCMNMDAPIINILFVIFKFLLEALPIIFTIMILITGITLLKVMASNHMGEEEIEAANRMAIISRRTVYISVTSNIALNIIQFILSAQINNTTYNLEFYIFPLIIAFAAIILSRFLREAMEIHDENEMFI